jgi:cytochrome P450
MKFLDPQTLHNPYPHYEKWRSEMPIWWADDVQAWVLSRYEDVRAVLKNPAGFSSAAMGEGEQRAIALPLLSDDPPRHTQLRAIVNKAFTSRTLQQMETEIATLVDDLLDDIAGDPTVDISEAFTIPLPIYIIARLMGIPEDRKDDFKRWSDALTGTSEATDLQTRMPDIMAMAAYFKSLIPSRREHPGDDLISRIVHAEVNGEGISDQDIVGFSILLLIAGNETTTNLLSNLLNYLAGDPEQWDALRNEPDKIDAAIEEILRFDAPVHWVGRKATAVAVFHDQTVNAGDTVITVLGSANRDAAHYDRPDEFRLDRGRSDHHTFGHGIHFCIGAPLGRLEARYALKALFKRYSRVKHAQNAVNERTHSHMLRGFHHLWLELER